MGKLIKVCKLGVKDVSKQGVVTMYVNTFSVEDSDGDISQPGSFAKTLQENFKRCKWFLNHDTTLLLGVPLKGEEDNKGLLMTGQLNMKKQIAKDILEDYMLYAEHDRTLEHSIGVQAVKRDDTDRRRVQEWRLWEFSTLTSWGANPDTPLVGIKSEQDLIDRVKILEDMLKKNYSDERLQKIEAMIKSLTAAQPSDDTVQLIEPDMDKMWQAFSKNNRILK